MSQDSFLPADYTAPTSSTGNYTKLADGETRLRLLSNPVIGCEYWNKDGKPVRLLHHPAGRPADMRDADSSGRAEKIKEFWAMKAYNYTAGQMQIFQITQAQIKTQLAELSKDADWGHPKTYDIKIIRSGKGLETKYSVTPVPAKPVTDEVKTAFAAAPINLEALFSGADPFASNGTAAPSAGGAATAQAPPTTPPPVAAPPANRPNANVPEKINDLPF